MGICTCKKVLNFYLNFYFLIENPADSACTDAGGVCQDETEDCSGSYWGGLCSGPPERKCCFPQGKAGLPHGSHTSEIMHHLLIKLQYLNLIFEDIPSRSISKYILTKFLRHCIT